MCQNIISLCRLETQRQKRLPQWSKNLNRRKPVASALFSSYSKRKKRSEVIFIPCCFPVPGAEAHCAEHPWAGAAQLVQPRSLLGKWIPTSGTSGTATREGTKGNLCSTCRAHKKANRLACDWEWGVNRALPGALFIGRLSAAGMCLSCTSWKKKKDL